MTPETLRKLIEAAGCRTQSEAAARIGVSRETVNRWLNGRGISPACSALIKLTLKKRRNSPSLSV